MRVPSRVQAGLYDIDWPPPVQRRSWAHCDSQSVQLAAYPLQVRAEATVGCAAGAAKGAGSTPSRNAEFSGSFAENSARNRAAARHTEPYGRRRQGGTRNMTVAFDGGAGARRLGCFIETKTCRPNQAGKHAPWPQFCEPRPVQLAASHLVRADATVSCRGCGGSAVAQGDEFIGYFAENGGHHRATQSPMACFRWVGHGT
jgi:hypothetical protein